MYRWKPSPGSQGGAMTHPAGGWTHTCPCCSHTGRGHLFGWQPLSPGGLQPQTWGGETGTNHHRDKSKLWCLRRERDHGSLATQRKARTQTLTGISQFPRNRRKTPQRKKLENFKLWKGKGLSKNDTKPRSHLKVVESYIVHLKLI